MVNHNLLGTYQSAVSASYFHHVETGRYSGTQVHINAGIIGCWRYCSLVNPGTTSYWIYINGDLLIHVIVEAYLEYTGIRIGVNPELL